MNLRIAVNTKLWHSQSWLCSNDLAFIPEARPDLVHLT